MAQPSGECENYVAFLKVQSLPKLETKASSHEGQCIPAGFRVTVPRRVLITKSVITMRSIFSKLCVRLFTLYKISTAIFEPCGAIYRRISELFSALQSASSPLTNSENSVQIVESMHNWRNYPSSNWYEIDQKTRFKIWRSVVAPSDATEKNRNIGAQLQSILCTTAEKRFLKIYFL